MLVISESACGPALLGALQSIDAGKDVRRASWPKGQFLRKADDGRIAVFRNDKVSRRSWVRCRAA